MRGSKTLSAKRVFEPLTDPPTRLGLVAASIPPPMAVPKKRTSSARRDKRRAQHKAGKPRLNQCPRCHSPRLPHRVCPACGTYDGREVIQQPIADGLSGGDS